MTREMMMDMVIRRFGFEADETINFCKLCENADNANGNLDALVEGFYVGLMQ